MKLTLVNISSKGRKWVGFYNLPLTIEGKTFLSYSMLDEITNGEIKQGETFTIN